MSDVGRTINGVANITMMVALLAASIAGVVAIVQQPWPWWQCAVAISGMVFAWGFLLAIVANCVKDLPSKDS